MFFIFFSWVIIKRHYQENEMVFLFIASQLMNIKTSFYFMDFLYLSIKKQQKQRDSRYPSPLKCFFCAKRVCAG
ncbi:hypothetical protein FMJ63_13390 [Klebsiella michiganensis]|nr:hypothetical protein [Klebsiella michiganensis]